MIYDLDNVKPPGLEILQKYSLKESKDGVIYNVEVGNKMEFRDKHNLFRMGWKNMGKKWYYSLILAMATKE